MKKILITLSTALLLNAAPFALPATAAEPLDTIVAVVNNDVITQSEFNKALDLVKNQATAAHAPLPDEAQFQKQVLNEIINKKLQLQLAKQAGITATPQEINAAVANIAKQNNVSVAELYDRVGESGLTKSAYQTELRDQITMQKVQQQEVAGHFSVSQEEVTSYIHSQAWHNNSPKEYKIEDVLVPLSDAPTSEEIIAANNRAKGVLGKMSQGLPLQTVVAATTADPIPLQGGDLGFRKLAQIPDIFAAQVAHMQTDQVAGPIQAPNGFHVIRLVAERDATGANAQPDRKQIEQMLLQQKFQAAAQTWVSKMRSQSFVKINL